MHNKKIKYYHISNISSYHKIFPIIQNHNLSQNIIFLRGNIGAGKTSFVREFVANLNVKCDISSPTFTLINEYKNDDINIYHYDLYRVENNHELFEIGIDYYFSQDGYHFIEWPEKFISFLPRPHIEINFKIMEDSRLLSIYT
tara:strand:- start:1590 stop:2018 length:429 start_codon:yes stop_codon:yes gene_type:complete